MSKNNYLAYLDGLRALAICSVLLFHQNTSWLPSGFLGVEVFFVISGYIISKLLLDEWAKHQRIDVKTFLLKRMRRLIPTLLTFVLSICLVVTFFYPEEIQQLLDDTGYGLGFIYNWHSIYSEHNYFEMIGRPRLLEHLWSLAIEFQFYLLWGVLFAYLVQLKTWLRNTLLVLAIALSVFLLIHFYDAEFVMRAYFGTDTRASALLIGCLTAFILQPIQLTLSSNTSRLLNLLGITALIAIVLLSYFITEQKVIFHGGFFCAALLTACIISCATLLGQQQYRSVLLSSLGCKVLSWIGIRSYGLYVWHWGVFSLTLSGVDIFIESDVLLFLFRLSLTFVCSELSYRFIETPIRLGYIERLLKYFILNTVEHRKQLIQRSVLVSCAVLVSGVKVMVVAQQQLEQLATKNLSNNEMFQDITLVNNQVVNPVETPDNQALDNTNLTIEPESAIYKASDSCQEKKQLYFNYESAHHYIQRVYTLDTKQDYTPLFFLGDSVMVGASRQLMDYFPCMAIDAQIGRQFTKGLDILLDRQQKGILGDTIIVHLGNNSPFESKQLNKLVSNFPDKTFVFINLKLPHHYANANNQLLTELEKVNSHIKVIDWQKNSYNHQNYFAKDGIHLTPQGVRAYVQLINGFLSGYAHQPVKKVKQASTYLCELEQHYEYQRINHYMKSIMFDLTLAPTPKSIRQNAFTLDQNV